MINAKTDTFPRRVCAAFENICSRIGQILWILVLPFAVGLNHVELSFLRVR